MAAAELISQAEYARRRGVDPTTVRDAVRAGRITLIDGKIDPAVADIQWERNTRPRAGNRSQPRAGAQLGADRAAGPPQQGETFAEDDYYVSRARREKAEADRSELEVAKLSGRLVERSVVEPAVYNAARMLRDRVMPVAGRAAPSLVGIEDVRQIQTRLEDELRQALAGFEQQATAAIQARVEAQP